MANGDLQVRKRFFEGISPDVFFADPGNTGIVSNQAVEAAKNRGLLLRGSPERALFNAGQLLPLSAEELAGLGGGGSDAGLRSSKLNELLGSSRLEPPGGAPTTFDIEGLGTFTRDGDGLRFREDPGKRALRLQRESLIQQFNTQLSVGLSPERVAQIDRKAAALQDKLFGRSEKLLRQTERQRGREGSALDDAMISLAEEVAFRAENFAEDLQERDRQATIQALIAVQAGADAQAGRAIQTAGLQAGNQLGREQLGVNSAQNLVSMLLGDETTRRGQDISRDLGQQQLALQQQQLAANLRSRDKDRKTSKFSSLGNIAGTLGAAAILA